MLFLILYILYIKFSLIEGIPEGLDLSDRGWLHKRYINEDIGIYGYVTFQDLGYKKRIFTYNSSI